MIKEQNKVFKRLQLFSDLFVVSLSFFVGFFLRKNFPEVSFIKVYDVELYPLRVYLGFLPILLIIWGSLLTYFGMYKSTGIRQIQEVLIIVVKTIFIGFILFGSYIFIIHMQREVSRLVIGITFLIAGILITLEKITFLYIFKHIYKKGPGFRSILYTLRSILIIGTGKRAQQFIDLINKHPDWGINIIGIVDMDPSKKDEIIGGHKITGSLDDIPEIIHNNVVDEAVFVIPRSWLNKKIEEIMLLLENEGITVNLAVDFFELTLSKARQTDLLGFPLLTFDGTAHKLEYLFIKRLFDFILSLFLLIIFIPVFLILAVFIKLTSPGPIFYKQVRCGMFGRKFDFYKFRTMIVDAESKLNELLEYNEMNGPVFKMTNDPRVTKIGKIMRKFSIDEIPQLWNVLKGEMSLVGPRPPLPEEVEQYNSSQRRKLSMRPGITCLWQIKGRSKITDFNDWMKLDLFYIDNWSPWLDFKILLRTIPVVLLGKGAK
jgi:exopolysaccharide biosynthesis polyprenyl glycosylphosphotransferase